MIDFEDVNDFVLSNFSKVELKTKNGNPHWHARCALCGDSKKSKSKKRFHLDWKKEIPGFNCFNCGRNGNFFELVSLIEQISVKEAIKKYSTPDYTVNNLEDKYKKVTETHKKEENKEENTLYDFGWVLKDCISLKDKPSGYLQTKCQEILRDFVKRRNLEDVDIPLYIAFRGDYKSRIIIPIFYNDKLIYFQGRRPFDNGSLKYLNPEVEKNKIILHKNDFDRNKYIIVTEGLIDAYCVGKQATTCLGKEISEDFLDALFQYTDAGIIVALDNDRDGEDRLMDLIDKSKWGSSLQYFIMPDIYNQYKDINDIKKYEDNLYEFVMKNSYSMLETYAKLNLQF